MEEYGSTCVRDIRPPMNKYTPSMWADIFSTFSIDHQMQETYEKSIEAGKKEIRCMLAEASSHKLIIMLLDTIERLGLAYHFKTEMKLKLDQIHILDQHFDLFTTALRFRLLRQHRYKVSCDVFHKFIGNDNKFEDIHSNDVEGVLSLYEACHVRIDGESVLEEAVAFTTNHLTRFLEQDFPEASKEKAKQALQQPLHKGVAIFNIRRYISIYEREESRIQPLLVLAKINFNFLQNIYKNELSQLTGWWNQFELKSKLFYARDRIVECYHWGVAANFEPQYSHLRIAVGKSMQLASILDDTYDNYATLAEAELFTRHLERWNMDKIDELPDYMQIVYRFIMSIYEDYERDATAQNKSFAPPYFKEAVIQLGRAYNQEQIWIMEKKMPSFDVYMNNSVITSCIYMMFAHIIPAIKSATKQDLDWLLSQPKIVISTAKMGRHLQDLSSHERENRGGKLPTVVDCYMKDRHASKQEALAKFAELVEDGWMDVNTEWAMERGAPHEMVNLLLNYARAAHDTYKNSMDGYTTPDKNTVAQQIVALFVDPIPI